jgi:crossover junction endodeoxyribonuclease RusA
MHLVEICIPERPVSVNSRDRGNLQAWKSLVAEYARMHWDHPPLDAAALRFSIVFLCSDAAPIDVDNVIKPIQDALNNVVYTDDSQLTDTDSHRRLLSETRDLTHASAPLIEVLSGDTEAVYIRVSEAVAAPGVYL